MPSSNEKSPLETAFERLFSQTFGCDWRDVLVPQYEVRSGGRQYFLDFTYISGDERIGIELDGRRKFFEFKHVFRDFFHRQNAIQLAGFTVYRFTWSDVVDEGGWRARRQLQQIFRGKLFSRSGQLVPIVAIEEFQQAESRHPVTKQDWLARLTSNRVGKSAQPEIIDAQVVDYIPARATGPGMMKGFVTGVVVLGIVLVAVEFLRPQTPRQPSGTIPAISTNIPKPAPSSRGVQKPHAAQTSKVPAARIIERVVHVPVREKPKQTVVQRAVPETLKPSAQAQLMEQAIETTASLPDITTPAPVSASPQSDATIDEIVAFNQRSGIYHRLNCTWAKRCRHCITIHMSEAVKMGGRPAKTCDPL